MTNYSTLFYVLFEKSAKSCTGNSNITKFSPTVWQDCPDPCPPTCTSLLQPRSAEECSLKAIAPLQAGACVCPPGLVEYRGRCMEAQDCPCRYRGQEYEAGAEIRVDCNTW
ncbi:unnamed protein product [Protopolystoma xenopodis]|uniref:TIL domain-containing protein n=1 Tax=Protopolystoma xenopodis TaxID=117903 RepID=A0A448WHM1_9PLAT|nr:unnamed protein product [Protopolystoma xenopodis]